MFIGVLNSPYEYGNKVIVESKTKTGARRIIKQTGRTIGQLKRITPQQADLMIMRRQVAEVLG